MIITKSVHEDEMKMFSCMVRGSQLNIDFIALWLVINEPDVLLRHLCNGIEAPISDFLELSGF